MVGLMINTLQGLGYKNKIIEPAKFEMIRTLSQKEINFISTFYINSDIFSFSLDECEKLHGKIEIDYDEELVCKILSNSQLYDIEENNVIYVGIYMPIDKIITQITQSKTVSSILEAFGRIYYSGAEKYIISYGDEILHTGKVVTIDLHLDLLTTTNTRNDLLKMREQIEKYGVKVNFVNYINE